MTKQTHKTTNPLLVGVTYTNATLVVGHPAERLKAASQLNLNTSTAANIHKIFFAPRLLSNLYVGLPACFYRQNLKVLYRSPLLISMPALIDRQALPMSASILLKALLASSVDTALMTPADNIKTVQMQQALHHASMVAATKSIFASRGYQGFFTGFTPSLMKSFPAWSYLFLSYQTTRQHRQHNSFLSTIGWGIAAATPITLATNPIDVIKTQMQKLKSQAPLTFTQTGKQIYQQHGLFAFGRGLPFRLIHKAATTATSFAMFDAAKMR